MAVLSGVIFAQAATGKAKISIKSDGAHTENVGKDKYVTEYPNATITLDDMVLTANKVVQNTDNNVHVFTATGNPVFKDKENTITGTTIKAYTSPRFVEVTGEIKMINKPDPAKNDGKSEATTVTCTNMTYDYATKTAKFNGNVKAVQNGKVVVADNAIYESESEMLYLTGNIKMKNNDKEELRSMQTAESVTMSLVDEWMDILAKKGEQVEFIFEIDE